MLIEYLEEINEKPACENWTNLSLISFLDLCDIHKENKSKAYTFLCADGETEAGNG